MAEFIAVTACNHPKLADHQAVEQLLARYYFGPEFHVGVGFDHDDGEPYLFIYGYGWPEAWHVPDGVNSDEFNPYEGDLYEEGGAGFNQLLVAVAKHLVQPLTVQAVGSVKCCFPLSACEWQIKPGGRKVQVNEFRGDVEPASKPTKGAKVSAS